MTTNCYTEDHAKRVQEREGVGMTHCKKVKILAVKPKIDCCPSIETQLVTSLSPKAWVTPPM